MSDADPGDIRPILSKIANQFAEIADIAGELGDDDGIEFLDAYSADFRKIGKEHRRMVTALNAVRKRQKDAIVAQQKASSAETDEANRVGADVAATISAALKANGLFQ